MGTNDKLENQVAELDNESKGTKKKKAWTYVVNILIVLVITSLAVFLNIKDDFNSIAGQLTNIWNDNPEWLLFLVCLIVGLSCIKGLIYYLFARMYTRKYSFFGGLAVEEIGIFYNAVTPGATGGQPMQAYTYKKQGVPISSAVSILAMYSIIYQLFLIVFGILAFIIKGDLIMSIGYITLDIGSTSFNITIVPLTIIGFLLNVGVIGIVLLMSYWKGFHRFVMGPIISLLNRLRIVKKPDKAREYLRVQVENFKIEMRRLFSNIPFLILICTIFCIWMLFHFSIPFFVGKCLGNESSLGKGVTGFFNAIWLSNYHQMVTGLIPLPGSAGASEIFFLKLFVSNNPSPTKSFFWVQDVETSMAMARAALLLWRSLTFIIPLTIAGFVTAFYRASPKEEAVTGEGKFVNYETMVALQDQTYKAREKDMETMVETSKLTREAIMTKLRSYSLINKKPKHSDSVDNITIDPSDDEKI